MGDGVAGEFGLIDWTWCSNVARCSFSLRELFLRFGSCWGLSYLKCQGNYLPLSSMTEGPETSMSMTPSPAPQTPSNLPFPRRFSCV